jgi:regulator of replication initiation timing
MPDTKPTPELTPERLRELRGYVDDAAHQFGATMLAINSAELGSLLDAADERDRLQSEMLELHQTAGTYHGAAIAAIEERDRLQVELDELKALASKSELAMAEDWRLATTAAAALKEERDRLRDALTYCAGTSAGGPGDLVQLAHRNVDRLRERVAELEEEERLDKGAFALVGSFIREINKLEHCALTSIARMNWALLRCPDGASFDPLRKLLAEGVKCGREILQQAEWQAEGKEPTE